MIESGKYKTMDIIGYLKSMYLFRIIMFLMLSREIKLIFRFEDAKAYARMKLMVVGVQGIGKTF